jgi:hypothetical protein
MESLLFGFLSGFLDMIHGAGWENGVHVEGYIRIFAMATSMVTAGPAPYPVIPYGFFRKLSASWIPHTGSNGIQVRGF